MNDTNNVRNSTIGAIEHPTQHSPAPVFWMSFGIAGIGLIAVALLRFPKESDSTSFILLCLIAFAVAALPWISSFRVKGLFEVERAIDRVKEETRGHVEQVSNRFDDKLALLKLDLSSQISNVQNSLQNQVSQQANSQTSRLVSGQDQASSNALTVNFGTTLKDLQNQVGPDANEAKLAVIPEDKSLDQVIAAPTDVDFRDTTEYRELRAAFAQATAAALNDPAGGKCGKLIRQIPGGGLSLNTYEGMRLQLDVTNEQSQIMKQLKLIQTSSSTSSEETVKATNLGRMFADYWEPSPLLQLLLSLTPTVLPIVAGGISDYLKTPGVADKWKEVAAKVAARAKEKAAQNSET